MQIGEPADPAEIRPNRTAFVQYIVHFFVICLLVAEIAPAVNESHYIPKARHVWDASFAPNDLFLESHDSHFLASLVAGLPATWLSFTSVAWLGRFASWALFAVAWVQLARAVRLPAIASPFALVTWHLGVFYGHWSGEWAMGGFEAKAIAYPLVLLGLARVLEDRWRAAWLFLAGAVAWHPLVGGWAGLSVGIVWLCLPDLVSRFRQQWTALVAAIAIGLVGVIPAATGLAGENTIGRIVASQVHVYFRLPHHMCSLTFEDARHMAAAGSVVLFLVAGMLYLSMKPDPKTAQNLSPSPLGNSRRLLQVAWVAIGFAVIGGLIDIFLTRSRPTTASNLLRFYWFRWADVAVPLASSLVIWQFICNANASRLNPFGKPSLTTQAGNRTGMAVAACVTLLAAGLHVGQRWDDRVPAADLLVVTSPGPIPVSTDDRYRDWLAVCEWIRENTPPDSLWLTPKFQQSFKWHAQRAEVVCWKDVPQDNASVHEWYRRVERCQPPRDADGNLREWTDEELAQLALEFGFEWVLLDRTIQQTPPYFEIAYPTDTSGQYVDNKSFAVIRIRPSFIPAVIRASEQAAE